VSVSKTAEGLEIEQQARGNAPRGEATRRRRGYEAERVISGTGGGSHFPEETGKGGEIGEDIGEKDESLGSGSTEDRETFEVPMFEGCVAGLGGVTGAVVETFPGERADGDVADETAGLVTWEGEADVENPSVEGIGVEMGALGGRMR
jgi:hypothetical protein